MTTTRAICDSTTAAVVLIDASASRTSQVPPFGREIPADRPANFYVYAGADAWNRARARRHSLGPGSTMLLPPGMSPKAFRWPRIPNGVLVIADDRATAFALARAIVSCGTPLAFAIFGDGEALIVRSSEWQKAVEPAA